MASETAPMPPFTNPHKPALARRRRPCSGASGCKRCPAERGPPFAPITPSVASVTLISGDSNHSSRRSAALCVKILTRPAISRGPRLRKRPSSFRYSMKSPGFFGGSSGGVTSSSDSTTTASRSRYASYFGYAIGIARGELRDFGQSLLLVLPEEEMAAVRESREEGRIFGQHPIAEALQFQFADDALLQQADRDRRRWRLGSRARSLR